MKKKTGERSEFLPPVKLYLDDISNLRDLLAGVCERVSIENAGFTDLDLSDLANLTPQPLRELRIIGEVPWVTVSIKPRTVFLYANQDDNVSRGLYLAVKELMLNRRRWLVSSMRGTPGTIVSFCVTAVILLIVWGQFGGPKALLGIPDWVLVFFAAFNLVLGTSNVWFALRGANVILPRSRHESPSFWQRNRDAIIVQLISGLALLVVGAAIGKYLLK